MSARPLPSFSMPTGFPELLKDFAREVLRMQPANVNEFAVEYFTKRIAARDGDSATAQVPTPHQQQPTEAERARTPDGPPARSAVVSFTGARHALCEDTSRVIEDVAAELGGSGPLGARAFVVCDGHGGVNAAQYVARELWKTIVAAPQFAAGDVSGALHAAFAATDDRLTGVLEALESTLPPGSAGSGACAVVALVLDGNRVVHTANVGDSRCVVARRGGAPALALTHDHKVSDPNERRRIEAAGGIIHDDRLLGVLAISRSFGDFEIKKATLDGATAPVLISDPETGMYEIAPDDVCLILASDGLWDALSNDEAADIALRALAESGGVPERACKALIKAAVEAGSEDDITVTIALLH